MQEACGHVTRTTSSNDCLLLFGALSEQLQPAVWGYEDVLELLPEYELLELIVKGQ
jgi:hypothetical protein